MEYVALILVAISLALDAFAVSITNGMTAKNFNKKTAVAAALCYGGFQFLMPLIGWLLGKSVEKYIARFDHWIAFGLLLVIGGKMVFDVIRDWNKPEEEIKPFILTPGKVILQGIATSIDALAVGISLSAGSSISIWISCAVIGGVAFVLPLFGGMAGQKIGKFFRTKAGLVGGLVLIAIGVKILLEHLLA